MTWDAGSSGQNVMLRSGTVVVRSHVRCSSVIAVRKVTLTGTPARPGNRVVDRQSACEVVA